MNEFFNKYSKGYAKFLQKFNPAKDDSLLQHLDKFRKKPDALVITCCDARVDPAIIFQSDPGDLFVVRCIAGIVPPYTPNMPYCATSAALEFAVKTFEVNNIILLGHSKCIGVESIVADNFNVGDTFVPKWLSLVKKVTNNKLCLNSNVKAVVEQSYRNCLKFPFVADSIKNNKLNICRGFFEIKTGGLFVYDEALKEFEAIDKLTLTT